MPNRSSFISAYSRQSPRTSQVRQTFLASLVDPPFSGKNASGSVCAHKARSCQPASSASASRRNSSLTVLALSTLCLATLCHRLLPLTRHRLGPVTLVLYPLGTPYDPKNTGVITRLSYTGSQGAIWYWQTAAECGIRG